MRKTNKMILAVLLLAVLLVGIGYASIQNITLNVTGTVIAEPILATSEVMFSGDFVISDDSCASTSMNGSNAELNVYGLTEKGQNVSATYTVQNLNPDLSVDLSVETTNSNEDYFFVNSELEKNTLEVGETTELTVTAELLESSLENVNSTIGITLLSNPVQSENEGTDDSAQIPGENLETTVGDITNDNIGDYIDLGNNVVGTENTSDDWRILYKEDDKVYAILADYLPVEKVPSGTELETAGKFTITMMTTELISKLTNSLLWNDFSNGITGITATGTPTADLLMKSYNTKNGTNLVYSNYPELDDSTLDFELYVPHATVYEDCYGYLTATEDFGAYIKGIIGVSNSSNVISANYTSGNYAIRPVLEIPSNIVCNCVDGVWVID